MILICHLYRLPKTHVNNEVQHECWSACENLFKARYFLQVEKSFLQNEGGCRDGVKDTNKKMKTHLSLHSVEKVVKENILSQWRLYEYM